MNDDGLAEQKRSVKMQFIVFFISFLVQSAVFLSEKYIIDKHYFIGAMIITALNPLWTVFPITYMFYEHHKAFRV